MAGTSFDELYDTIGRIVQSVTGRHWWRSTGMQSQPEGVYATIYLGSSASLEHQAVENLNYVPPLPGPESADQDPNPAFVQRTWGTAIVDCVITFFRSGENDSSNQAATRFINCLYIDKRYQDLWRIAGLIGRVRRLDISGVFRADIEPRTEVRFSFYANISGPGPVDSDDNEIYDIQSQKIDVIHVRLDGSETEIPVNVDPNEEESPDGLC